MNHYPKKALRTENRRHDEIAERFAVLARIDDGGQTMQRLLHAALGLSTEAGELLDAFKKALYYGKPLDTTNVIEELGDLLWYIAQAADALGVSFELIQHRNLAKLAKRYPHRFTETDARSRDLHAERQALEGGDGR